MKDQNHKNSYGLPSTGFIRERQLLQLLPFARGTLLNMTAAGEFPPKYKLSKGVAEVIEWFNAKTQREVSQ